MTSGEFFDFPVVEQPEPTDLMLVGRKGNQLGLVFPVSKLAQILQTQGLTGDRGPKGDQGERGEQGLKGDLGAQGPAGLGFPDGWSDEDFYYIPRAGSSPPVNGFFWAETDEYGFPVESWQQDHNEKSWISRQSFSHTISIDDVKEKNTSVFKLGLLCFPSAIKVLQLIFSCQAKDDMKSDEKIYFDLRALNEAGVVKSLGGGTVEGLDKNEFGTYSVDLYDELSQARARTLLIRISGGETDLLNVNTGICYKKLYVP